MRIFLKAFQLNLKVYTAYPKGFLMTMIVHPIILILNIYLFKCIFSYNGTSTILGYSLAQMIWYSGIVLMIFIFIYNFTDMRMSNYILTGDLGTQLLRPMSLFNFELANALALRCAGVMFEFIPDFIIFSLLYPPEFMTMLSFIKFLSLVVLSFCLYYLINFLIGLSAIFTQSNAGLQGIVRAMVNILGGTMIPLDFFPNWLQRICDFLPFKSIFYIPIQFFLNRESVATAAIWQKALMVDLAWIIGLYICCRVSWMLIMKKIVIVGG